MSYPGQIYKSPQAVSWTTLAGASIPSGHAITNVGSAITLYSPTNVPNYDNFLGQYMTAPSTPYCAIANLTINQGDYVSTSYTAGIPQLTAFGFYDGTKLVTICPVYANTDTMYLDVFEWTSVNLVNSAVFGQSFASGQPSSMINWFMIRDDGTNIHFYVAMDGNNNVQPTQWVQLYSQGRTSYLANVNYIVWGQDVTSAGNTSSRPNCYCTLNSFQTVAL